LAFSPFFTPIYGGWQKAIGGRPQTNRGCLKSDVRQLKVGRWQIKTPRFTHKVGRVVFILQSSRAKVGVFKSTLGFLDSPCFVIPFRGFTEGSVLPV
jgi:hypothetical protein